MKKIFCFVLLIYLVACSESPSPTANTDEGSVNLNIPIYSSSSNYDLNTISSFSNMIDFVSSSSDPAQNIRPTSGFYVRFIANLDSVSGWMPAQTFFPEIPQYLEKNNYKRDYCSFLGWALTPDGNVVYNDGASVIVSSDVNLYAKWNCWEPLSHSSSSSAVHEQSSSSIGDYSFGSLYDNRDGKVYGTTTIGTQTWMAENLNFDDRREGIFCYNGKIDSCSAYGRLYTWIAAIDSIGKYSNDGKGCGFQSSCKTDSTKKIRGICPEGWHLPSKTEFEVLFRYVGYNTDSIYTPINSSAISIALRTMFGWPLCDLCERGANTYQFSAKPAGRWDGHLNKNKGEYLSIGGQAYFWTSTKASSNSSWYISLNSSVTNGVNVSSGVAYDAFSVRCIKDAD